MRRNHYIILVAASLLLSYAVVKVSVDRASNNLSRNLSLSKVLDELDANLQMELMQSEGLGKAIRELENELSTKQLASSERKAATGIEHAEDAIAVLVLACNRPSVAKCLNQLIQYRPSAKQFPIIVSQDCAHKQTSDVIDSYRNEVYHIHQPDQSDVMVLPAHKKYKGYYKIARHYEWALNETFFRHQFRTVIVVEDDLDVSPDFYEYFSATLPLLEQDESLMCVSAWNDNGKSGLIDPKANDLLYRTDFFPGLGWMLTKSFWMELSVKWPTTFWDDWLRRPEQRRDRSCIRPEISRTRTFGKIGVSRGQYFDKHLKYIELNTVPVGFTWMNLSHLKKETYDRNFLKIVDDSQEVALMELKEGRVNVQGSVRVMYDSKESLKRILKSLALMDDFRSGVPRTSYLGIVSCMFNGRRVFIAPRFTWRGYDPTW